MPWFYVDDGWGNMVPLAALQKGGDVLNAARTAARAAVPLAVPLQPVPLGEVDPLKTAGAGAAMRVIVSGSRSWTDRGRISERLAQLDLGGVDAPIIVVGYDPEKKRPKGVDEIAYQEAHKLGLLVEPHPAYWDVEGKGAGFARNERMAKSGADLCIAFWDGRSTGTLDMITRAVKHGILVDVVMKSRDA